MKHETLILGSSPFALGYAEAHEHCRIFESGFFVDPVFAASLSGFEIAGRGEYSAIFEKYGDTGSGVRDLLRSEVLLAERVLQKGIALSFAVEALEIESTGDEFCVTYLDAEGLHREVFGRIIDTREPVLGEIYRVLCKGAPPAELSGADGISVRAERAYAPDTYLLVCTLPRPMMPDEAKAAVAALAGKLLVGGGKWLMAAHRTEPLRRSAPALTAGGYLRVCDRYFGTPEAAYDAGREAEL